MAIYALNLFDLADNGEYLKYAKRSAAEVEKHGGKVLALGKYNSAMAGDIEPRRVMILVEWESKAAFDHYCNDPDLADLHPHREQGTNNYIWHLFDKLDGLKPLFYPSA